MQELFSKRLPKFFLANPKCHSIGPLSGGNFNRAKMSRNLDHFQLKNAWALCAFRITVHLHLFGLVKMNRAPHLNLNGVRGMGTAPRLVTQIAPNGQNTVDESHARISISNSHLHFSTVPVLTWSLFTHWTLDLYSTICISFFLNLRVRNSIKFTYRWIVVTRPIPILCSFVFLPTFKTYLQQNSGHSEAILIKYFTVQKPAGPNWSQNF
jgi:hypothetical protein